MRILRKKDYLIILICFLVAVMCIAFYDGSAYASTKKGNISKVANVSSGIRVSWEKDSSKSGYRIYRKAGNATKWTMVKEIKKASKTTWIDKDTTNGTKYTYKVRTFKKKKIYSSKKTATIYRLDKPTIDSLTLSGIKQIRLKSDRNKKVSGYEIKYSVSSKFKNSKTVKVKGKTASKRFSDLKAGKVYYFKIRAYKVSGKNKYYSSWSDPASLKARNYYNVYTTDTWTSLHTEPNSGSDSIRVWYNTKLKAYDKIGRSSGSWVRVKYNKKNYYVWSTKAEPRLTINGNLYNYISTSNSDFQNEILKKALYIFKKWDTKYDYTHKAENGVPDPEDGKYPFDCSNFVSYVYNSVMQKYCPAYSLSAGIEKLAATENIINNGLKGELNAVKVCEGKPNYNKLKPGDLLFFRTENADEGQDIDHVAIYLGGKELMHSVKIYARDPEDTYGGVCIAPIPGYNEHTFKYALRVIPKKVTSASIKVRTISNTKIYPDIKCTYGTHIDQLYPDTPITIMYTIDRRYNDSEGNPKEVTNAYVRYDKDKYGFIFDYKDTLGIE